MNSDREDLVNHLKTRGITDQAVLDAVGKVERQLFVPDVIKHHAYKDVALPIGHGQTISQPYTVAFMTQALRVKKDSKILEIGTGSGYQAAILHSMGAKVFSIERFYEIYTKTQKLFDDLGIRVALRCGDGTIGWEEFAPYDGIIVTAGGPNIPDKLRNQLAVGGVMVIPVGDRRSQTINILTKVDEDNFEIIEVPDFAFVPLIGRDGWKEV
ncbi:MAG: protein-L-isoaspartate(D-aspartate) O-methyltransferase [Bacteroidetes bacterium]|nr:protein-L-isoaspartate(D-aspartate) O-methyltransferase [Bacteroidota bacterium]MBU1679171.1 protein-L-isoaspartate(D-aspartate) O-methyltransferase [Bacteroidota bacterium]MBU2508647.1 protein-L-isoaspartate(D-aspartate) O-methyltransferase [Bacteroidota bacterium]